MSPRETSDARNVTEISERCRPRLLPRGWSCPWMPASNVTGKAELRVTVLPAIGNADGIISCSARNMCGKYQCPREASPDGATCRRPSRGCVAVRRSDHPQVSSRPPRVRKRCRLQFDRSVRRASGSDRDRKSSGCFVQYRDWSTRQRLGRRGSQRFSSPGRAIRWTPASGMPLKRIWL